MLKFLSVFGSFSSEESTTNKKIKEKKIQSKKEAEEGAPERSEVKRQSKQSVQCDEKKNKCKPQINDPPRKEGKDTKVKKKKSCDRDSGLGEMIDNDNSHPSDSTRGAPSMQRRKQAPKYGYFNPESEGKDMRSYDHYQVDDDDDDDDNVPLGLQQERSASSLGHYQNHESQEHEEKNRSSYRNSAMFPNGDRHKMGSGRPPKSKVHLPEPLNVPVISSPYASPSPVATTPPLVFNNRQTSRESRQYHRERKFSSSNSSVSSASFDSGIRTRGGGGGVMYANQHSSPSTQYPPSKNLYHNNIASPGWNGELDYYAENYNDREPRHPSVPPTSRVRNLSLNLPPRSDSFTRDLLPPRRASECPVPSRTNPTPEKDKKAMKISDYHKYQEENIAAQYQKYRVNPLPIADEEVNPVRPMTPTLMQIQHEYKSLNTQNGTYKRLVESSRRVSMTESSSGRTRGSQLSITGKSSAGRPEHRKNHSETTIMQQQLTVPRAPQPQRHASSSIHPSSQFHNSATSLSSSGSTSGSGGPPTPSSRRSSVYILGSRPGTPSTGGGYVVEKEKRKKSALSTAKSMMT